MELNKYILAKAIENKICQEWADKISVTNDPEKLLDMYVAGIDFCLDNNFPSNSDLVRLSGDSINARGIYVDQQFKLSDRSFVVLLGSSKGSASYTGFSASQLFVKHKSSVKVIASGNASVMIDCFDHSAVEVDAIGNSKITVNVYGKATISATGNVKIVHKLKDTY